MILRPRHTDRGTGGRGSHSPRARGFVLVAVLIVIMLASMVAISLLFRLRAEETAATAGTGSEQAWAAAMSGVYEAMRVAAHRVPGSIEWMDDPATFRDRFVCEDGADRWYFTVYAAGDLERGETRFGLTDEAGKLNVNWAAEAMLTKVPSLTPYLAQGLADFLDADDLARPEGAEQEYYDTLPNPYAVRNGPLETFEELRLVRGFTPQVLYGEDANLNFTLDPNEDDGEEHFPLDNKDGKLDPGLRHWLTVYSHDLNEDNDGLPRNDLNFSDDTIAGATLPPALVSFVELCRSNKVTFAHAADLLEAKAKVKDEQGKEVEIESGVGKDELPVALDFFTATNAQILPGLINVNTASKEVLQCLPDVDEGLAEAIVTTRQTLSAEQRRTPAWLFQEDLVDAAKFKQLARYVTARGFQYHVQVVGYGVPSGRYRVLEAVIDVGGYKPAIIYLRDLTRLGLPFRIELAATETGSDQAGSGASSPRAPASAAAPNSP